MAASAVRVFITLECRQERRFISRKQSYWNKEWGIPFLRFFPEKRRPRRFMVDQEVNLPEKSGVVTAELTFKLYTNSFGSEDSWRITLTDYIDNTDFILDWYTVPSWVIFARRYHCFAQKGFRVSQLSKLSEPSKLSQPSKPHFPSGLRTSRYHCFALEGFRVSQPSKLSQPSKP